MPFSHSIEKHVGTLYICHRSKNPSDLLFLAATTICVSHMKLLPYFIKLLLLESQQKGCNLSPCWVTERDLPLQQTTVVVEALSQHTQTFVVDDSYQGVQVPLGSIVVVIVLLGSFCQECPCRTFPPLQCQAIWLWLPI